MKKLLSIVFVFAIIVSCNNKTKVVGGVKEKTYDTAFNEKIQGMFFGVSFGDNKEEVISKLKAHDFAYDNYSSSDVLLHFRSKNEKYFSFGNMPWEMLDISTSSDKFYHIRFMNSSEDKATVISSYEHVLSTVSAKYKMMEETPKDSTVYRLSVGYTRGHPRRLVIVSCFRYESLSKHILQGYTLEYSDEESYSDVNYEL